MADLGPVVQRLIIAKPGLHLNLVSLFFFHEPFAENFSPDCRQKKWY